MIEKSDNPRSIQYELMRGREVTQAIKDFPVAYLPAGCLERHGDHLPMGLDALKAHMICCLAAKSIGGIVFPPDYYSGIHRMTPVEIAKYTGEWGNIYTDRTAKDHLSDIIEQIAIAGIKVLVLYSGHYPECQVEMIQEIAADFTRKSSITVIPFCECMIMEGEHAGISETSFLLYLQDSLVDMTQISEVNYKDHGWSEANSPEKASYAKGKADTQVIIAYLKDKILASLDSGTS